MARRAAGEGHALLGLDLGLGDARELVLDRVLDGHDVDLAVSELAQGAVECRRLAGPRRTRHHHDAVAVREELAQPFELVLGQIQVVERVRRARVENPDDALLGSARRDRGDTQIVAPVPDANPRLAVLGPQAIGDVEAGQHLDA